MKTPMQQIFYRIEQLRFAKNPIDELMMIRLEMLEKEKEVMSQVYADGGDWDEVPQPRFKNYYNQTFNTKER